MFYTETINIYIDSESSVDEYGIVQKGESVLVDTLLVDIQPVNKAKVQKDYGISEDVSYVIYSPPNSHITTDSKIEYKGKMYKIITLEEWNSFYEFLVGKIND